MEELLNALYRRILMEQLVNILRRHGFKHVQGNRLHEIWVDRLPHRSSYETILKASDVVAKVLIEHPGIGIPTICVRYLPNEVLQLSLNHA